MIARNSPHNQKREGDKSHCSRCLIFNLYDLSRFKNLAHFTIIMILMIIVSACQSIVPASVPVQLSHTPSVPIVITDNHIEAEWFSLDYPDGWRVVTNIGIEPLRLTLVSPDDEMIIWVIVEQGGCIIPDVTPEPNTYWRDECLNNGNQFIHISGSPDLANQAIYDPIFNAVVSSIQFE